jgi:hypothetical protein
MPVVGVTKAAAVGNQILVHHHQYEVADVLRFGGEEIGNGAVNRSRRAPGRTSQQVPATGSASCLDLLEQIGREKPPDLFDRGETEEPRRLIH